MWGREQRAGCEERGQGCRPSVFEPESRRAYYRVTGLLPIRLTPLEACEVDAAIFDLSLPDPLLLPVAEGEGDSLLNERLRRIEEKLDLLLGVSTIDVPKRLCGRDRRPVVFSGAGIALDVTWSFRRGDAYKVEILLPPPYSRTLRAVAEAVQDSPLEVAGEGTRRLALGLRFMEDDERDALIGYSYDLQRFEIRTRTDLGASR